jgi:hypothetical protein
VHLLRERRSSFVELYAYDNSGKTNDCTRRLSRAKDCGVPPTPCSCIRKA